MDFADQTTQRPGAAGRHPRRSPRSPRRFAPLAIAALALSLSPLALRLDLAWAANAPAQAETGPGGKDYRTAAADIQRSVYGAGSGRAFVFAPRGQTDGQTDGQAGGGADGKRPVVVFLHGPGAISPSYYGAWIEHLVRRGDVVIYPLYEDAVGAVRFEDMTGEALKGLKAALAGLAGDPSASADLSSISFVGHSGGAVIAANLAAHSGRDGLPPARLVFGAMPARPGEGRIFGPPLEALEKTPAGAVTVMLVGDKDTVAGERGARQILQAFGHLGQERRLILKAGSDNHGSPSVHYSHYAPVAPNEAWDITRMPVAAPPPEGASNETAQPAAKPDPAELRRRREEQRKLAAALWRVGHEERQALMNYEGRSVNAASYAVWRLFDLAEATVRNGGDAMTLRRDPRIYDMGKWSDGWPLRRLNVETPKPPAARDDASEVSSTPGAPVQETPEAPPIRRGRT